MIDYVKQILTGQFEASLGMLGECIRACPPEQWEGKIAALTFQQLAYHTLFFVDLYLEAREEGFELRELHRRGGDERRPVSCDGLPQDETLAYLKICRTKALETLAAETAESLAAPSGFSWLPISRGELHIYNIRHVQHHAGQLSAYLRRVEEGLRDRRTLPWVKTGWPEGP